jgi:KipI family sensor histidine kinase inhibitor
MNNFRILKAADSALVIEFGSTINRKISNQVLGLAAAISDAKLPGVSELVATFRSLSVSYDSLVTTGADLEQSIRAFVKELEHVPRSKRLWNIPVCYDPQFAPDIDAVARTIDLSASEVAALHAAPQYHVYMIGFVPGYPYMGDLPAKLQLPRRTDPRTRVPAGSLAIATSMTAVYPYESPGGWHLIGTSPVRFFDAASASGALLSPGDGVKFWPVAPDEFDRIRLAVERGQYVPDNTEIVT